MTDAADAGLPRPEGHPDRGARRGTSSSAKKRAAAPRPEAAKSRFLATMSHELRTPLNAILGFSEVMKDEMFGPQTTPVYREYAQDVYDSGRHLLQLINEILDLSRIEAGRYDLARRARALGRHRPGLPAPADAALQGQGPHRHPDRCAGPSAGLDRRARHAPDLPQPAVERDEVLRPGGSVTLTVAPTPEGGQYLAVRDTGPGILEDEIPRVMQAFGQGSLAHEAAEGGTGLGLPIVQKPDRIAWRPRSICTPSSAKAPK